MAVATHSHQLFFLIAMSFQFSHQFHSNWLAAPAVTRRQIKTDLDAIVELLKPETSLSAWQKQHGIFHTDTTKAEQASLFFEDEQSNTSLVKVTNTNSNKDYGFANSTFLQSVTSNSATQKPATLNNTAEKSVNQTKQQHSNLTNISKTALNPKALATHNAKNKSEGSTEHINNDNFLASLEAKVDDYLAFATQNIKKDIMAWLQDELLKDGIPTQENNH